MIPLFICGAAVAGPRDGIVVAGSPYAAQVGAKVLERGGNAVDAAVATAFALTVVEPGMSGLGGRTVLLVGRPGGRVDGMDGFTQWPRKWVALRRSGAKVEPPKGWGQVAIPGTLGALVEANRKWGRLPLAEVMRPAIYLARHGFSVSKRQADWMSRSAKGLASDPTLRRTFLRPDGGAYRSGDTLRQTAYARTLELIARRGSEVFYRGEIARAIASEMKRHGGYVTYSDLAAYRPRPAGIVSQPYRNLRIASMDRPSMGRVLIWSLDVLKHLPSPETRLEDVQAQAEVMSFLPAFLHDKPLESSYAKVVRGIKDRRLTDKNAGRVASVIAEHLRNGTTGIPLHASPSQSTDTTHLVVADRNGWVVSLTQSLGDFFGPKVALPKYGITFAGTMGSLDDSDVSQGPFSSLAPTILFDSHRNPVIAVGAAGGDRIPATVFQVIHNLLDRGMDLRSAVAAPRLSFKVTKGLYTLSVEGADRPEGHSLLDGLRHRGIHAVPLPAGGSVARVHALMRLPSGEWAGAADPRYIGSAVVPSNVAFTTPSRKVIGARRQKSRLKKHETRLHGFKLRHN